ncbi:zinc finger protein 583-like [Toxorhynchites rutilus septentrionalis]|uniref:zinc finger protein 583-like n=1 Tax=Toxorhynchites rutilus septentrionalis TaxID=329112 RepID=UPI00247AA534|nr:zinc finger protein 583-like [Toxorhynchites rutilus septentrionalis]
MDFYATICRLCETSDRLSGDDKWSDLFSAGSETLLMMIGACTSVVTDKADNLPKRICGQCNTYLQQAYDFRVQCELTDAKLRHEIEFLEKNNWDIGLSIPPFDDGNFLPIKAEDHQERTATDDGLVDIKAEQSERIPEEDAQVILTAEESELDEKLSEIKENPEMDKDQTADEALSNDYDEAQSQSERSAEPSDSDGSESVALSQKKRRRPRIMSDENDGKARANICETCGEQFEKAFQLYEHARSVHGKKRFQCTTCSKWFCRRSRLRDHELQHSGIRQFECTECDRKYATQQGLKAHMECIHIDVKPHVCDKCGKGFAKPGKLRDHYGMHSESRNFLCGVCSKGFKTKAHLNLHMNTHLPEDQKKVRSRRCRQKTCVCPYCGKVSNSVGTHTMHIRTHTGEQRYECHICAKRFTSSGSHKKHLRVHSGEKPFSCEFCQKTFRQKHHVTTHIRGVHTNEKPYECKFCPKAFATKGNLTLHLRSHGGTEAASMITADCFVVNESKRKRSTATNHLEEEFNGSLSDASPMLSAASESPMMNSGLVLACAVLTDQSEHYLQDQDQ